MDAWLLLPLCTHVFVMVTVTLWLKHAYDRRRNEEALRHAIVLVTGAAQGIGRAISIALLERHAHVRLILLDSDREQLHHTLGDLLLLVKEAEEKEDDVKPRRVFAYVGDVACAHTFPMLLDKLKQRGLENVTHLICNAGVNDGRNITLEQSIPGAERVFQVNTLSWIRAVRCFVPAMVQRREGYVITVSSIAADLPGVRLGVYSASKAAVRSCHEALELELARDGVSADVMMTLVQPFLTSTRLFRGAKTSWPSLIPVQMPDDIARVIVDAICSRSRRIITIPKRLEWPVLIFRMLPIWLRIVVLRCAGAMSGMDNVDALPEFAAMNDFEATPSQADKIVHEIDPALLNILER